MMMDDDVIIIIIIFSAGFAALSGVSHRIEET